MLKKAIKYGESILYGRKYRYITPKPKRKKITIVGAVETTGTYLINPFSTITGALAYSGGISEVGSLRDIKLIRNNGEVFSFDFMICL